MNIAVQGAHPVRVETVNDFSECFGAFESDKVSEGSLLSTVQEALTPREGTPFHTSKRLRWFKQGGHHVLEHYRDGALDHTVSFDETWKNVKLTSAAPLSSYTEYFRLSVLYAYMMFSAGYITVHASAISHGGEGILFIGTSGSGKSTQSSLWLESFPDVTIINDDKPMLSPEGRVHGTPFAGTSRRAANIRADVKALVFIEKSEANHVKRLSKAEATASLYEHALTPEHDKHSMHAFFDSVDTLLGHAPAYHYRCTRSIESVHTLRATLFKEGSHAY